MHKRILSPILVLFILNIILFGCKPTGENTASVTPVPEADMGISEISYRFSIEAGNEQQPSIIALYEAFYPQESPKFVNTNGDLVISEVSKEDAAHPLVRPTYLPGVVMIPQIETAEIQDFIKYALSVEGQRVLIEAGFLPATITLTDQGGNTLTVELPLQRVISTYGPATAFIYSVDAEDRLVSASYLGARDPQGSAAMEKIDPRFPGLMGDDFFSQEDFNIEQAAALDPDMIVTSARTSWLEAVEQLGLPIFLYDAETPEGLIEAMLLTGQLFGPHSSALAEAWIAYYQGTIQTIQEKTASLANEDRPRVLFTGTQPLRVASGEMYQTDLIQAAGGVSVSAELKGYWNDVNLEQVVIWDPDILIVPPYGGATVEAITESPEWQILDAVKAGRVYQMPKLVVPWDTPAPDSILGIIWLARYLHPDILDINCRDEVSYFYNTFYQYAISQDEIETFCSVK